MNRTGASLIAGGLMLAATQAIACEPVALQGNGDGRVRQGLACAFEGAGKGRFEKGRGAEAIDVGKGFVAQKVVFGHTCYTTEYLLYVDCNTGQAALAMGRPSGAPLIGGTEFNEISAIQPPHGPVSVSRAGSVANFLAMAKATPTYVETDARAFAKQRGASNAFDPMCGCKLYYPSSTGAGS